ncbi:glutaredoxin family protein [Haliovirga abyssi]|uniref:NrdH-redoxin n=1 Tax=Haliovirga abyssi TaxID=2996794 RepID=A0AAU9DBP8_9FUSO|nr:glutaredoxin family protein [Haliovirga abyssi]BDU50886.1 NrdH-redoxin [Haliovirga abyssi]
MSVIVYSTNTCPYCDMTKQFLSEKGVPFNDINVAEDPIAAREMVSKSGQMGVPVIDFNGTIVLGFDRAKLESLI